jgi:hypothetical protein
LRGSFKDKTAWDWLQLFIQLLAAIALPVVLSLAAQGFSAQQSQASQQIAADQQRETTLKTCLDDIKDLLLNKSLRVSKPRDEVRVVARVEVLAALRQLDRERKGLLMQFLSEAGLITSSRNDVIIALSDADLGSADLFNADLRGANLYNANLGDTDLRYAHLSGADLSGADLYNADLSGAEVTEAQLKQARSLEGATMPDGSKHS